ncbi:MAG TPA: ceramidase domain-containing protein [Chitinophagales bacterium]|nr:ceramidase domain-containing protein [Chitinophagales bacterium]
MQKSTIYKIYGIALLTTSAMLLLFVFLNLHYDGSIWQTMQQSKSALTAEYCELDHHAHFFRQSINTYSNLAYFFLGMIAVLISFYDKTDKIENKNLVQQFPFISCFFGVCLIYLSIGSAFFHASLTWIGQRIDMNATYSICIVLIGISYYRLLIKENASNQFKRIFVGCLFLIILLFIQIHLLISSLYLLPFLILLIICGTVLNYLQNKPNFNISFAILSLLLMIGAFILRTMDVQKIACDPTSVYQGHALWHFFTGMSAFLLYWFYRSERLKTYS